MYKVYGYFEVEHHDYPCMEYFISEKELKSFMFISEHATHAEAEAKIKELEG